MARRLPQTLQTASPVILVTFFFMADFSASPCFSSLAALLAPSLLPLDSVINLFTVHRDTLGRINADPDLIPLYPQNGDRYLVSDHYGLTDPSCQYQHSSVLLIWAAGLVRVHYPLYTPDAMGMPLHQAPSTINPTASW